MSASLLARLIEAGTPADLIGEVALLVAKAGQLEERRAAERDRKRRSREVTGSHVTGRDGTGQQRPSPLTSLSTQREEKEEKRNPPSGGKSPAASRGSRLPADWQPSEADRQYAASKGLSEADASNEAEKFRNHFHGATNAAGGLKVDWAATWRKWVLRSLEMRPPARAGPPQGLYGRPAPVSNDEILARIRENDAARRNQH